MYLKPVNKTNNPIKSFIQNKPFSINGDIVRFNDLKDKGIKTFRIMKTNNRKILIKLN